MSTIPMKIELSKHPLIEGLYIYKIGDIQVFFQYVQYDHEDQHLVFERANEVVTSKLALDSDQQLEEWDSTLSDLGVKLEYLE
ncbi:hypothetical protein VIBNISOn1_190002 [Vibrio nigripulchritudo SOn1]|uniref:Uncharacterized protein n=1 Tax=Vibrio nigripulchritudo SOn1 TaxID=1238450 RepID=A0AAV2VQS1_9VIBR|nr:hypothetical protein [Vibrio nigripulchritudo]CCO46783.1 hypothetical protein VIBNISOn1_190002 [Vibrio nigripulchritudo SOn1]